MMLNERVHWKIDLFGDSISSIQIQLLKIGEIGEICWRFKSESLLQHIVLTQTIEEPGTGHVG
jgi:hypothetical protein